MTFFMSTEAKLSEPNYFCSTNRSKVIKLQHQWKQENRNTNDLEAPKEEKNDLMRIMEVIVHSIGLCGWIACQVDTNLPWIQCLSYS